MRMADRQDEIDALNAQVAALTARVYQLEQISGLTSEARQQTPAPTPVGTTLQPPSAQTVSGPRPLGPTPPPQQQPLTQPQPSLVSAYTKEDGHLEKKIGQYWLNR